MISTFTIRFLSTMQESIATGPTLTDPASKGAEALGPRLLPQVDLTQEASNMGDSTVHSTTNHARKTPKELRKFSLADLETLSVSASDVCGSPHINCLPAGPKLAKSLGLEDDENPRDSPIFLGGKLTSRRNHDISQVSTSHRLVSQQESHEKASLRWKVLFINSPHVQGKKYVENSSAGMLSASSLTSVFRQK